MKSKKIGLVLTLFVAAIALMACGNKDDNNIKSEGPGDVGNKDYKTEMNIAVTAQPPTLDPSMTVSQVALNIAGNVFETLYTLNANYEPVPMLAESVDVSEDGKTYTFKLREGVKFHNGEEMTAEDVVASMNRWVTTSSRAKSLLTNAEFTVQDPTTVVLTLESATSDVLIILATKAQFPAIMPAAMVEAASAEGVNEYIGTGPFQFEEWKQDQYIHLVKNEEYQAVEAEASGLSGKKEAFVEDVHYHFVTDHSTRIAGIQTGQYDIAESIPLESYEQLNSSDDVQVSSYDGGALTAFYNTNEGLLADVKIREAITTGLKMDEILLASYADADLFSLNPGYMNPNQTQWATNAGEGIYNAGDVEKAKQLLQDAGYNGEEITLLTTKDYGEMYTATIVIQEQLRQMGVNVKVENFDFPTFLERKNDFTKWDIFVASTGYQLTPPQLLAVTPDWAGTKDAKITELLTAIRSAESPEAAQAKWDELQGYLYEYLPSTVIGHYKSLIASTNELEGFTVFEAPILWNTKVIK
ncbi:ABC transporter substrate-binding protein [Sporosarcina sp. FSL K6-3457]|uniref:ABC transporter substrate-binding protein n=1 Tax=Sporosarcina sp. FSL K6-3457 TaxID=2978204 RepID=UPI0030FCBEFE